MNLEDICIGDIAVAKDGKEYEVLDAYFYPTPIENLFRLDLRKIVNANSNTKNESVYPYFEYSVAWIGATIEDLNKTFDKIGEHTLNIKK